MGKSNLKDKILELKEMVEGNDNFTDIAKETVLNHFTGTGAHIPLYPIEVEFRNFIKQIKAHNELYLKKINELLEDTLDKTK